MSLREHACVSSRGAQSTELVSLYIGYWTLNNYYYYYIPPLSNCKDMGEQPSSLHNHKHTKYTHATRVQNTTLYSDGTTHSKQHRSNQMAPPAQTITVALDMSKAFDTINIHTPIRKLLQTNIPGTIIKFIANYIMGRKAYTTYKNHTSSQHKFKTGVRQGGVLSPALFNIYTADIPPARALVQVIAYADDITITSTHTSTSAAKKYIQPYLHKVFAWKKQINRTLNPDKTTCTLFTPDPAEYKSNLNLKINNTALRMATHPKVLSLTLDPKLTYSTHIHNFSVQAHKPLQMIKALIATGWGKQKETLMATYKAVMRPALEYASSIWSPLASSTSIYKLQVMQNAALRTATGCTQDTNIRHLHDETFILPIHEHLQLHASQYKHNIHHTPYTNIQHTLTLQG